MLFSLTPPSKHGFGLDTLINEYSLAEVPSARLTCVFSVGRLSHSGRACCLGFLHAEVFVRNDLN